MRIVLVIAVVLVLSDTPFAQEHKSQEPIPTEVVIGRDSFIDVGPPFNDYDLTFLRSEGEKTEVERVSLTPARRHLLSARRNQGGSSRPG